jgi:HMP-PP phosphatase
MNRTRLLAFDLDGTLLDPSHRIPEMTRFLLSSLREAGIETTVATGRPYAAVQGFIGELAVRVPLIVFNGAVVVSPDGECLWSRRLPRDVAGGALSLLHDPAVANHLYLDPTDAFFYTDHMGAAAEHVMKKDGMGGRLDVDLAGLLGKRAKDPVKLFSIGPRKKLEEAKRRFDASAPECTCVFSEHDMLEFLGPDVTKGAALGILCDSHRVGDSVWRQSERSRDAPGGRSWGGHGECAEGAEAGRRLGRRGHRRVSARSF